MASPTSEHLHFSGTLLSSIPVASSTSSSSPSASSTSDSGSSNSGLFSTAGSPALVLAFLAIGIFAGGLISMLFLRRMGIMRLMRQRQLAQAESAGDPLILGRRSRRRGVGEKPKLWEYKYRKGMRNRKNWDGVVPISVKAIQPLPPPVLPEANNEATRAPNTRPGRLSKWFQRHRPPPSPSTPPSPSNLPGRLHITVAIAMPTRQTPPQVNSRIPIVPVYELGLVDVPWESEKFSSLNAAAPSPTEARPEAGRSDRLQ